MSVSLKKIFKVCPTIIMYLLRQMRDAAIITFIALFLIEFVGLFIKPNQYFFELRQLFASKNAFRPIGDGGLWTYKPNSKIMSAAVYHLSRFKGWIEYRCVFDTDKFGFVATNFNNQSELVDYLVLGDSFTEGQGGCPWLTRANLNSKDDPSVINAGLQGAGVQQFELTADWVAKQVKIENLILIAISNDFKRGLTRRIWRGREECLNGGLCDSKLDFWWGVDAEISDDDLFQKSKERFILRRLHQARSVLRYYSLSYRLFKEILGIVTSKEAKIDSTELAKQFNPNFKAILRLRERFPNMKVLLVPQRDEVGFLGVENKDTQIVKTFLQAQHFDWHFCKLGMDDYMPIDEHPNKSGYEKLLSCLRKIF